MKPPPPLDLGARNPPHIPHRDRARYGPSDGKALYFGPVKPLTSSSESASRNLIQLNGFDIASIFFMVNPLVLKCVVIPGSHGVIVPTAADFFAF